MVISTCRFSRTRARVTYSCSCPRAAASTYYRVELSGVAVKSKDETASAIICSLARLHIFCGRTANRLHTDNTDEQNTAQVKELLRKQGTSYTFTVPGSSPSSAIVEWRFSNFFRMGNRASWSTHAKKRRSWMTEPYQQNTSDACQKTRTKYIEGINRASR